MYRLRDYQEEHLNKVRTRLRRGARRVILQAPTGSGKSVMIAEMIRKSAENGYNCWLLCHRRELLDQLSDTLTTAGVEHG